MSRAKEKLENKNHILQALSPEYVSIYRIELNTGKYEILRLSDHTNAKTLVGTELHVYPTFDAFTEAYEEKFILPEERSEFRDWFSCRNMKSRLLRADRITSYYQSISEEGLQRFYEAYAVKGYVDEEEFNIFLAFRNVDSILYKERAVQDRLQRALDEAELKNEVISALAKIYPYISRIDIQADYFDEVANLDPEHMIFRKSGCYSEGNRRLCRELIAEEYQDIYLDFTDLRTLPERMQTEAALDLEYRMKKGDWHKARFIEKKRDQNGRLTHVLCTVRSISAAKKKEQELLHQVAAAKLDAVVKSNFLSNMSHDIRTPLNGILGMVELANQYPNDLEMQKKCREKVMQSSQALVSLVNDILEMTRLESGAETQEVPFDLQEVVDAFNGANRKAAAAKGIEYEIDYSRTSFSHTHLVGDPVGLSRLIRNCADNAVKFTEPGGRIQVWCKEQKAENGRAFFEFGCEDTGIGMSDEFIRHAFDMFSQEQETSRTDYEGSGLGLAIAKGLAGRLGGTLAIRSEKGIGTTVLATVAFQIGTERDIIAPKPRIRKAIDELRVLVAEDNELNMEIVQFMLEKNGVAVECASDGLQAVQRFKDSEPGYYDAVFMDIRMPNLDGWEATGRIRAMERPDAQSVPIIALSANGLADDIIGSRLAGMNYHLLKPLSEDKILTVLSGMLEKN